MSRCCGGLAVFIKTHKRDIQLVAREVEVVGITAEEADRLLGDEDKANVSILTIRVKFELAPMIKVDDLASILR